MKGAFYQYSTWLAGRGGEQTHHVTSVLLALWTWCCPTCCPWRYHRPFQLRLSFLRAFCHAPSTTSTSDLKPTSPILANLFGGRSGGRRSRVWRGGGGVDCDAAKKLALVTCVATNTISVLQLAVARTCSTTAAPALQSVRPYCHTQSVSRVDNPALHFYPHLPIAKKFLCFTVLGFFLQTSDFAE